MPQIEWKREEDRLACFHAYKALAKSLSREQLELMLLLIIAGVELDYAYVLASEWGQH